MVGTERMAAPSVPQWAIRRACGGAREVRERRKERGVIGAEMEEAPEEWERA